MTDTDSRGKHNATVDEIKLSLTRGMSSLSRGLLGGLSTDYHSPTGSLQDYHSSSSQSDRGQLTGSFSTHSMTTAMADHNRHRFEERGPQYEECGTHSGGYPCEGHGNDIYDTDYSTDRYELAHCLCLKSDIRCHLNYLAATQTCVVYE